MSTNLRSLRRALALVAAMGILLLPAGVGASTAPLLAPVAPTLAAVGSIAAPAGFGVNAFLVSPNGERAYGISFGNIQEIDLASMSVTNVVELTGQPQIRLLSSDRSTVWIVTVINDEYFLQSLDLDSGEIGTPIALGGLASGLSYPSAIAVGSVGGVNTAFIGFAGYNDYFIDANDRNPRLVSVDLDTRVVANDPVDLVPKGVALGGSFGLALAADGTELYLSNGNEIAVLNTANFNAPHDLIDIPAGLLAVHDSHGPSSRGELYAAVGNGLVIYDLDSNTEPIGVSVGFIVQAFDVTANGDAVFGGEYATVVYFDRSENTVSTVDISAVLRRYRGQPNVSGQPNVVGLHVDENAEFGTCIFTANNYDSSYTAISVDGADCGPFGQRFDDLSPVPVNGSTTLTYTPPAVTDRAAPWQAIAVFADCKLVEVIEPPFSGSLTVDWADVAPATALDIRAYTAADLVAGSIGDDLTELTCSSPTVNASATTIGYPPLAADSIGAGDGISCASSGAQVYCWGNNGRGSIGDNTFEDRLVATLTSDVGTVPEPVLTTSLPGLTALDIDSGAEHTCALSNGTVFCWGSNSYGQLGVGLSDDWPVPRAVAANAGFLNTTVTSIAVGFDHTCAVESAKVYCWGTNGDGQLGDGTRDDSNLAHKVLDVDGVFSNADVTSIGAGAGHTCAVAAGSAYCWGYNGDGGLGDDTAATSLVPVKVAANGDVFANIEVTQVVAGEGATCALKGGSVYCWGYDHYGQLGWDGDGDSSIPILVLDNPDAAFVNTNVTRITGGESHFCALRGGVAFCWGDNGDGQLGDGTQQERSIPTRVADVDDGFTNAEVTDIDAGFEHTCAIASGKAFCWGSDPLGNGTENRSLSAVPVCCGVAGPGATGHDLRVQVTGAGSVTSDVGDIDCSDDCTTEFDDGQVVRLTATPADGYRFVRWTGACSGSGACVVSLAAAGSVTAIFESTELPATGGGWLLLPVVLGLLISGTVLSGLARRRATLRA